MKKESREFDFVVCGGGLAGFSAALSAARQGLKCALIQDRPVLGGNSSSEVRVTVHGAAFFHGYARETGILSEALIEERAANHEKIFENGWTNSVWDLVLYDMVEREPHLSLFLNTTLQAVSMLDKRTITSVTATVAHAETEITFHAPVFADCTGDGVLADLAGCEWRLGSEARSEFNEPHAPGKANAHAMGNSIHLKAKDMGCPVPFTPPDWAHKYEDASFFTGSRRLWEIDSGFWWLEIGLPWHTIYDNETIRHELTRHALGVWDWIKNRDEEWKEHAANLALDWVGQVPGKRESRRIMGRTLLNENDVVANRVWDDEVAFGGWFIDIHTPGGLLAPTGEPSQDGEPRAYCGPYGIPLGICLSKDVDNLLMAGRNVSVTKCALATVRVMGTTALMGQAVGTLAAKAHASGKTLEAAWRHEIKEVQQQLLRDGCFLPNIRNGDSTDLARKATVAASSQRVISAVAPHDTWHDNGIAPRTGDWGNPLGEEWLDKRRGQWIALDGSPLHSLAINVHNRSEKTQTLDCRLLLTDSIWDYRTEGECELARGTITVPAGAQFHWAEWEVGLPETPGGRYARLDVMPDEHIAWHRSLAILPGHLACFEHRPGQMLRYDTGLTLSFRVNPGHKVFPPSNVINGVTRPHRFTNSWQSDPAQRFPQWLQLDWTEIKTFNLVELTFAGHLLREYHAYPPLFRDPQTLMDYDIQVPDGKGGWLSLLSIRGNYQRQRRHRLPDRVSAKSLRILCLASNGDPCACVYEIRVY